ncbi:CBS domain-containing protein [Paenibacillus sp. GCM10012307]|uniref:CBS domain-containing protein n=1 Tax=Paenibacillus roseus TaxID=2798579 RepID=A0A934J1X3_9BACL|nr:CBS domain-containing protein [Paenibacillus roseus]MBJ6363287.1 CBS domain-containing protein [Paenibacillus roseus]
MRTVKEIMTTDCITATQHDNIYELAVMMKNNDIGFVPIVEGRKLLGVVTDRDLVVRGYAQKHSGSTSVTEVLTTDIETIAPSTSVDEAARIMARNQIRRLPVVENGELLGVVAIGDLAIREIFADNAGEALSHISEQENQPSAVH